MIKFLIDECLHTSLVNLAHDAGYPCDHVNFLGRGGQKDWELMARIQQYGYTFVTNNRTDFNALYSKEELHSGLVVIIPNVTPSRQQQLFAAALAHLGKRDLVNAVLEVTFAGTAVRCREFRYPMD